MLDHEYHSRELSLLAGQLARNDLATMADRKQAQADALDAMQDIGLIQRNLEWVLNGNYGYGAMVRMQDIAKGRGNRPAQAMQLLMALDHFCPARHCIAAWKQLSSDQQSALNTAVLSVLDSFKGQS